MLRGKANYGEKPDGAKINFGSPGLLIPGGRFQMPRLIWTILCTLVLAMFITACSGSQPLSTREEGTLGGGVLGAGTGAIIGAAVGHPGAGAAIGGALGAGTGYVVSNSMQNSQDAQAQTQNQMQQQQQQLEQ